jgi:hypothetical protein
MENKVSVNAFTEVKGLAEKEMKRMAEIFAEIKVLSKPHAQEFYDFSKNYFEDGKHFYDFEKYVQAFEAFIISWAYLDIGLKLKLFETKLTKHFTA